MKNIKHLSPEQRSTLIRVLKDRFNKNRNRDKNLAD